MTGNRALFGIQYVATHDTWMNGEGNLQAQIGALFFDTREDAQRFLDGRRLRRGFRPRLQVSQVDFATVRQLASDARGYSTTAVYPAADHRPYWLERAEYLESFLPLATVH